MSGCTGATCHLQQHLQESWFLSCCYLLLTVQLFKLPHAITLLFASTLAEYKTKSACENQELKLHCQESKFLIIYSATYGRWAHEENICSTKAEHTPPFGTFGHHWGTFSHWAQGREDTGGEKLLVLEQWCFESIGDGNVREIISETQTNCPKRERNIE